MQLLNEIPEQALNRCDTFFANLLWLKQEPTGKASRSKTLLKGVVLEDSLPQNHSLYKTLYTQISERKPKCSTKAAGRRALPALRCCEAGESNKEEARVEGDDCEEMPRPQD